MPAGFGALHAFGRVVAQSDYLRVDCAVLYMLYSEIVAFCYRREILQQIFSPAYFCLPLRPRNIAICMLLADILRVIVLRKSFLQKTLFFAAKRFPPRLSPPGFFLLRENEKGVLEICRR